MNKEKRVRQKTTTGPKIDQMLSSMHTRASEANSAPQTSAKHASSDTAISSASFSERDEDGSNRNPAPNDFAMFTSEMRDMYRELQGDVKKVGADVTSIMTSIVSLKSDMANFGNRLGEAEERVSRLEDDHTRFENTTTTLSERVVQLEARLQYQENYSRRNNLRIKGVPENTELDGKVTECVIDVLRCLFPSGEDVKDIIIERAHRVPPMLQQARQDRTFGPRHILVRFLRYADREKVRRRAWELKEFKWKDARVEFYPDFTKEVQDKRNKFTEVRRLCMSKGLKYTLQYPAVFWVTLGGRRQRFVDATDARRSIEQYRTSEEVN
ncbi:hypothetical protein WMY93_031933 [Mugilogobius chulae]|uniref:L1 transposable element RRM domain-containing protein n=1 Tax=Mugilogobius chulae TaxID=88201 RepID=A0AAW0MEM2_9GOBI